MAREDRRPQLIETALSQFLQYGYRKTTLDDIAEAAGLQKSSLYHYFTNKEDLFQASVSHLYDVYLQEFEAALNSGGTLLDDLELYFSSLRERLETMHPKLQVFSGEWRELVPIVGRVAEDHMDQMEQVLASRLKKAETEGELSPVPAEELALVLLMFSTKIFTISQMSEQYHPAAIDIMKYVRAILAPYFTKS